LEQDSTQTQYFTPTSGGESAREAVLAQKPVSS
jgi:hypothetical protein